MKRMGGWLGARQQNASTKSLTALDEPQALQQAMAAVAHIMNDDVDTAETELNKGNSPFHKLGHGVVGFLRATLGFEQEVMRMAAERLAEAETTASDAQRRAHRDSKAYQSAIYPVGSEYALCYAQSQLMSAVVAVLNESLTESIKGFYRLRKAFATLQEISDAEKRYVRGKSSSTIGTPGSSRQSVDSTRPPSYKATPSAGAFESGRGTPEKATSSIAKESHAEGDQEDDDDDDFDFVDAEEKPSELPTKEYTGHLESPTLEGLSLNGNGKAHSALPGPAKQATTVAQPELDMSDFSNHPVDEFIHSGSNLCFGVLQLMLSMIPPAFSKLLYIVGFKGDRDAALIMLWNATRYHNINGALAGLITLGFHNGAIAFCDILTKDALPEERLRALLAEMRAKYPKSRLWLLEEARMRAGDKKLEEAVDLTAKSPKSPLKQVEALQWFEQSLNCMYLHRYEVCATSFLKCIELNNWSHGLYYYIAGSAYVELYRTTLATDATEAQTYKAKALELLKTVQQHTGKKRFMARQLPFDIFINRKIAKWEARSKDLGVDFVDAVGVSPIEEMCYFWNGYKRMRPEHLQVSLQRLQWSEQQPGWAAESVDERAILSLLRAAISRFLGDTAEAKEVLQTQLLCHSKADINTLHHDNWTLPVAHYEMAVCFWIEAGGQDGEREGLVRCSEWLEKVVAWGSYELDARIGLKITTARDTLRKCGVSPA